MKVLTVIGARPQFIKSAIVSKSLEKYNITEQLLHTGQHYDSNMSDIFFEELGMKRPDYNLGIGSGTHAEQTGKMLIGIEKILMDSRPDKVLVYGDTNSTLAAALAASKLHIPVCHVEAGLRSFNRRMPEEQNRILTDHISSTLFCPTENSVTQLHKENIRDNVFFVGDVMFDSTLYYYKVSEGLMKADERLGRYHLEANQYYLATLHRAENTDIVSKLQEVLCAFEELRLPVLFPVHPRIKKQVLEIVGALNLHNIKVIEPVGYLDMLILLKNARKLITDSGGLQKEAFFLETNCITLREETEWIETLRNHRNILVPINEKEIIRHIETTNNETIDKEYMPFGDGNASDKIAELLLV